MAGSVNVCAFVWVRRVQNAKQAQYTIVSYFNDV